MYKRFIKLICFALAIAMLLPMGAMTTYGIEDDGGDSGSQHYGSGSEPQNEEQTVADPDNDESGGGTQTSGNEESNGPDDETDDDGDDTGAPNNEPNDDDDNDNNNTDSDDGDDLDDVDDSDDDDNDNDADIDDDEDDKDDEDDEDDEIIKPKTMAMSFSPFSFGEVVVTDMFELQQEIAQAPAGEETVIILGSDFAPFVWEDSYTIYITGGQEITIMNLSTEPVYFNAITASLNMFSINGGTLTLVGNINITGGSSAAINASDGAIVNLLLDAGSVIKNKTDATGAKSIIVDGSTLMIQDGAVQGAVVMTDSFLQMTGGYIDVLEIFGDFSGVGVDGRIGEIIEENQGNSSYVTVTHYTQLYTAIANAPVDGTRLVIEMNFSETGIEFPIVIGGGKNIEITRILPNTRSIRSLNNLYDVFLVEDGGALTLSGDLFIQRIRSDGGVISILSDASVGVLCGFGPVDPTITGYVYHNLWGKNLLESRPTTESQVRTAIEQAPTDGTVVVLWIDVISSPNAQIGANQNIYLGGDRYSPYDSIGAYRSFSVSDGGTLTISNLSFLRMDLTITNSSLLLKNTRTDHPLIATSSEIIIEDSQIDHLLLADCVFSAKDTTIGLLNDVGANTISLEGNTVIGTHLTSGSIVTNYDELRAAIVNAPTDNSATILYHRGGTISGESIPVVAGQNILLQSYLNSVRNLGSIHFIIETGGSLVFDGITFLNGSITINGGSFEMNSRSFSGNLLANGGSIVMRDLTISDTSGVDSLNNVNFTFSGGSINRLFSFMSSDIQIDGGDVIGVELLDSHLTVIDGVVRTVIDDKTHPINAAPGSIGEVLYDVIISRNGAGLPGLLSTAPIGTPITILLAGPVVTYNAYITVYTISNGQDITLLSLDGVSRNFRVDNDTLTSFIIREGGVLTFGPGFYSSAGRILISGGTFRTSGSVPLIEAENGGILEIRGGTFNRITMSNSHLLMTGGLIRLLMDLMGNTIDITDGVVERTVQSVVTVVTNPEQLTSVIQSTTGDRVIQLAGNRTSSTNYTISGNRNITLITESGASWSFSGTWTVSNGASLTVDGNIQFRDYLDWTQESVVVNNAAFTLIRGEVTRNSEKSAIVLNTNSIFSMVGGAVSNTSGLTFDVRGDDAVLEVSGGVINNILDLRSNATLSVSGSASIDVVRAYTSSTFIAGGSIEILYLTDSNLTMSGGLIKLLQLSGDSSYHLSGGSIDIIVDNAVAVNTIVMLRNEILSAPTDGTEKIINILPSVEINSLTSPIEIKDGQNIVLVGGSDSVLRSSNQDTDVFLVLSSGSLTFADITIPIGTVSISGGSLTMLGSSYAHRIMGYSSAMVNLSNGEVNYLELRDSILNQSGGTIRLAFYDVISNIYSSGGLLDYGYEIEVDQVVNLVTTRSRWSTLMSNAPRDGTEVIIVLDVLDNYAPLTNSLRSGQNVRILSVSGVEHNYSPYTINEGAVLSIGPIILSEDSLIVVEGSIMIHEGFIGHTVYISTMLENTRNGQIVLYGGDISTVRLFGDSTITMHDGHIGQLFLASSTRFNHIGGSVDEIIRATVSNGTQLRQAVEFSQPDDTETVIMISANATLSVPTTGIVVRSGQNIRIVPEDGGAAVINGSSASRDMFTVEEGATLVFEGNLSVNNGVLAVTGGMLQLSCSSVASNIAVMNESTLNIKSGGISGGILLSEQCTLVVEGGSLTGTVKLNRSHLIMSGGHIIQLHVYGEYYPIITGGVIDSITMHDLGVLETHVATYAEFLDALALSPRDGTPHHIYIVSGSSQATYVINTNNNAWGQLVIPEGVHVVVKNNAVRQWAFQRDSGQSILVAGGTLVLEGNIRVEGISVTNSGTFEAGAGTLITSSWNGTSGITTGSGSTIMVNGGELRDIISISSSSITVLSGTITGELRTSNARLIDISNATIGILVVDSVTGASISETTISGRFSITSGDVHLINSTVGGSVNTASMHTLTLENSVIQGGVTISPDSNLVFAGGVIHGSVIGRVRAGLEILSGDVLGDVTIGSDISYGRFVMHDGRISGEALLLGGQLSGSTFEISGGQIDSGLTSVGIYPNKNQVYVSGGVLSYVTAAETDLFMSGGNILVMLKLQDGQFVMSDGFVQSAQIRGAYLPVITGGEIVDLDIQSPVIYHTVRSFAELQQAINDAPNDNTEVIITIDHQNLSMSEPLFITSRQNITLVGQNNPTRLSSGGSQNIFFTVLSGGSLIISDNISLGYGRVNVTSGGLLIVSGGYTTSSIHVNGGDLRVLAGTINGLVDITSGGTFDFLDGSLNLVSVSESSFAQYGGVINDNITINHGSNLILHDGVINGNLLVGSSGVLNNHLTIYKGEILGTLVLGSALASGELVLHDGFIEDALVVNGSVTMNGGLINTIRVDGALSSLIMNDGVINLLEEGIDSLVEILGGQILTRAADSSLPTDLVFVKSYEELRQALDNASSDEHLTIIIEESISDFPLFQTLTVTTNVTIKGISFGVSILRPHEAVNQSGGLFRVSQGASLHFEDLIFESHYTSNWVAPDTLSEVSFKNVVFSEVLFNDVVDGKRSQVVRADAVSDVTITFDTVELVSGALVDGGSNNLLGAGPNCNITITDTIVHSASLSVLRIAGSNATINVQNLTVHNGTMITLAAGARDARIIVANSTTENIISSAAPNTHLELQNVIVYGRTTSMFTDNIPMSISLTGTNAVVVAHNLAYNGRMTITGSNAQVSLNNIETRDRTFSPLYAGDGGVIEFKSANGTLSINNGRFYNNSLTSWQSEVRGGVIFFAGHSLLISDSHFEGNAVAAGDSGGNPQRDYGGSIFTSGEYLEINNTVFSRNIAQYGTDVFISDGHFSIYGSQFTESRVTPLRVAERTGSVHYYSSTNYLSSTTRSGTISHTTFKDNNAVGTTANNGLGSSTHATLMVDGPRLNLNITDSSFINNINVLNINPRKADGNDVRVRIDRSIFEGNTLLGDGYNSSQIRLMQPIQEFSLTNSIIRNNAVGNFVLVGNPVSSSSPLPWPGNLDHPPNSFIIENCSFNSNRGNYGASSLIHINDTAGFRSVRISNSDFIGNRISTMITAGSSRWFLSSTNAHDLLVEDCSFRDNEGIGIFISSRRLTATIRDTEILNTRGTGVRYSVALNPYGSLDIINTTIVGNRLGLELSGGTINISSSTISNSIYTGTPVPSGVENSGTGIYISGTARPLDTQIYYDFPAASPPATTITNVTICDSVIQNNENRSVLTSQSLTNLHRFGGGIYLEGGTLVLENSTISNNIAPNGAGITVLDGSLNLRDSEVSGNGDLGGNTITHMGGGLLQLGGLVSIENSSLVDNLSNQGAGIWTSDYSILSVDSQTIFDGNTATGGIYDVGVHYRGQNVAISTGGTGNPQNILWKSTSLGDEYHILNNYDINYNWGHRIIFDANRNTLPEFFRYQEIINIPNDLVLKNDIDPVVVPGETPLYAGTPRNNLAPAFVGWGLQWDSTDVDFYPEDLLVDVKNISRLYAIWTFDGQDEIVTVTFHGNGGEPVITEWKSDGSPLPVYVDPLPPDPQRQHYDFVGWYTAPTGGNEFTSETSVSDSMDVWARWELTRYTVTYLPGEQGLFSPYVYTVLAGSVTPEPRWWDLYGNEGWYLSHWLPEWEYFVWENVTYVAQWEQEEYVVYYGPGYYGTFDYQVYEGLSYGDPTPEFVGEITGEDGWIFIGWQPVVDEFVYYSSYYEAQWSQPFVVVEIPIVKEISSFSSEFPEEVSFQLYGYWYNDWNFKSFNDPFPANLHYEQIAGENRWVSEEFSIQIFATEGITEFIMVEYPSMWHPEYEWWHDGGMYEGQIEVVEEDGVLSYSILSLTYLSYDYTTGDDIYETRDTIRFHNQLHKPQYQITYLPGIAGTFDPQIYDVRVGDWTPEFDGEPTGLPGWRFSGWDPLISALVWRDAIYVAQWTPEESAHGYTVTFIGNGGTPELQTRRAETSGEYALLIDFPDEPTWLDHPFTGWNFSQDGSGDVFDGDSEIRSDITVYAQWGEVTNTVTFDLNYPEAPIASSVRAQGYRPLTIGSQMPDDPRWGDHPFAGWNHNPDGSGGWFDGNTVLESDLTVYAIWDEVEVKVTFDLNYPGASLPEHATARGYRPLRLSSDKFPEAEWLDHGFKGWHTDPGGDDLRGKNFDENTVIPGDITVYAQWEEVTNTVTFDSNNSSGLTEDVPATGYRPLRLQEESFPAFEWLDHELLGWHTDPSGDASKGSWFTDSTVITEDITVYAQWGKAEATVTFDLNYPGAPASEKIMIEGYRPLRMGDKMPADPEWLDHPFLGWNTQSDGTGSAFDENTALTANITVYAQWGEVTNTVTFDTNNPFGIKVDVDVTGYRPLTLKDDDFPAAAWLDHPLIGWNFEEDGSGGWFTESSVIERDITVYAQWGEVEADVIFDLNYPEADTLDPVTVEGYRPLTVGDLMPETPRREWHRFVGWHTGPDGENGEWFDQNTVLTEDEITVYAQWEELELVADVTFNFNDDETPDETVTARGYRPVRLRSDRFPEPPDREWYRFREWNTKQDGSGEKFTEDTILTGDITVYAQWDEKELEAEVTFDLNFEYEHGDRLIRVRERGLRPVFLNEGKFPEPPNREWYRFREWNTDPEGNGSTFDKDTELTEDITVYAVWEEKEMEAIVTFDANGGLFEENGEGRTTRNVRGLRPIRVGELMPLDPKWEDHPFIGWNTERDGSGSGFDKNTVLTGDITVYAQWGPVEVEITFDANGGLFEENDEDSVIRNVEGYRPMTAGDTMPDDPEMEWHKFREWTFNRDGSGGTFDKDTVLIGTEITVYAQWDEITFEAEVTFDANGGAFDNDEEIMTRTVRGRRLTLGADMPDDPDRSWFRFVGWNRERNGSGEWLLADTELQDGDSFTVYAQWDEIVWEAEVEFDANEGTFEENGDELLNRTARGRRPLTLNTGMPDEPVRRGYRFVEWNFERNGSGRKFDGDTELQNGDKITVYAIWDKEITITFDGNGGVFTDGSVVQEKEILTRTVPVTLSSFPENPDRNGYAMTEWNTEADGSGDRFDETYPISESLVVYAQWSETEDPGGPEPWQPPTVEPGSDPQEPETDPPATQPDEDIELDDPEPPLIEWEEDTDDEAPPEEDVTLDDPDVPLNDAPVGNLPQTGVTNRNMIIQLLVGGTLFVGIGISLITTGGKKKGKN